MKHAFSGKFFNGAESIDLIGAFEINPQNVPEQYLKRYVVLKVSYHYFDRKTQPMPPLHKHVYITIDDDEIHIGDFAHGDFEYYDLPLFQTLRDIVIAEYEQVKND